ncbi:lysylphosphatidylglycerol synthase transmembrane domain-containing protein [Sphaerisporangium album]|uniref:lysylphosphatidylglycerol synthase transmembrane domain-containing protein n=1 Tax=Sphaerisporangium album TaxID=509200 RepID=UPI0015F0EF0C|nr:lysylphosphatidylglycerol synthase transmembrane domain-containing protein [Sphaerisporangium album]
MAPERAGEMGGAEAPAGRPPRSRTRLAGRLFMIACVVVVVVTFRDRLPDPGEIWALMTGAHPGWLIVAVTLEASSMRAYARLIRHLLTAGGAQLTLPRAVAVTYARTAVSNSLPGGQVLSVAYTTRQLRVLGATTPLIAATLVLTAVFSTMTFLALGVAALLAEPSTRAPAAWVLAALSLTVALAVRFRPRGFAGWLARRGGRLRAMVDGLRDARAAISLTRRDAFVLPGLALTNWLLDVGCLVAVCLATGVSVGPNTVLLGYVAAKAAGVMALVPGGLGISEIGMAATFAGAGMTGAAAAAVVAIYRLISYWGVLIVGWGAWLTLNVIATGERPERRPSR